MGAAVTSKFVYGVQTLASIPPAGLPEVALMGRSNVGKSTFLNRITRSKALARVSKTPGRTQQLNFFETKLELGRNQACSVYIVDLPGFGYAKLPHEERNALAEMIIGYIETRESLRVVCILNDLRREPTENDIAVAKSAFEAGKNVIIVATKSDEVKKSEISKRVKAVAAGFGLSPDDIVVTGEGDDGESWWRRIYPLVIDG